MQYQADSPQDYINQLPEDRKKPILKLRKTIIENLPKGFEEGIQYGMISYYVPHSIYPNGYHCKPTESLPFMSFASQKNSINLYHSGIYAIPELYNWFVVEYPKYSALKLDMGKSCIRFKNISAIPYPLIAQLAKTLSVKDWIGVYERVLKRK